MAQKKYTDFQIAREYALRAGKKSFEFQGKKYITTTRDVGDEMGNPNRPGSGITFTPEQVRAFKAAEGGQQASTAPAPARSREDPPATRSAPQKETSTAPRRDTLPSYPKADRAAGTRAERDGDDDRFRPREEDRAQEEERREPESRPSSSSRQVPPPSAREETPKRDADDREKRPTKYKAIFEALPDNAGYQARLKRLHEIEDAQGKDKELQRLNADIDRLIKANRAKDAGPLIEERERLLQERYGEEPLGRKSFRAILGN